MTRLLFTCMKNEAPYLLDWVGYHTWLGFTDFLIFTNDCDDGTDAIADRLQELGVAQHVPNTDIEERGPQWTALKSKPLKDALAQAEWAMHLDVDEYLAPRTGGLDQLIDAIADADALSLPWQFFGNAGADRIEDTPLPVQFTRCGPYPVIYPRVAMMFKTLFRPSGKFAAPGIHGPRPAKGEKPQWFNGDGRPVSNQFDPKRSMLCGTDFGNSLGQINHYALRSREGFLVKSQRGLPNHRDVSIDLTYWTARNFNDHKDNRLSDRWSEIALNIADLKNDATLAKLHNDGLAWHQNRAAELLRSKDGIELYAALTVAGDTRAATPEQARKIYDGLGAVYGSGAQR